MNSIVRDGHAYNKIRERWVEMTDYEDSEKRIKILKKTFTMIFLCTFARKIKAVNNPKTVHVSYQEIRYLHRQTVWYALRRNVLYQFVRADDAVFVALCG